MKARLDPWLRRLGIDPKRYWLLTDLFEKLSSRQELMNQSLGHDRNSLLVVMVIYAGLAVLMALLMISAGTAAAVYLKSFLALTAFTMMMVLLIETANTLVNPVEGMVLVHQPINGATYTAAKLTHLGRIVVYLAGGMNLIPAMAGFALKETTLLYPLGHLSAALLLGFAIALTCCAVFGWLMRYVPASRMKMASQVLSGGMLLVFQFGGSRVLNRVDELVAAIGPRSTAALVVLGVAGIALGLRTLSTDYLIRVNSLVQGGAKKKMRRAREWGVGAWVGRAAGGPAGRAGFAYVTTMMRRDWHFIRGLVSLVPAVFIFGGLVLRSGKNPFSGEWSGLLVLPHLLGFFVFSLCASLIYGAHHEATWLFGLAPASAFPRFARGVFGALWLGLVAAPHALLLPGLAYLLPAGDAVLFSLFSAGMTWLYLALCLQLVDGIPFGSAPRPDRGSLILPALLGGAVVAGILVGVEYLIFHERWLVGLATAVVGGLAVWLSRGATESLAVAMRHDLDRRMADKLFQQLET